ncbi:hypothetical protein [Streptomyces sp. NPDC050564]|uniref:hypothetical protein n=1 Tax=Streptomyces sp. NPDC050564 TaxID=3365631 RepID=UPI0037913484
MERRTVISDGMAEVLRSLHLGRVGDPAQAGARALGAAGVTLSLLVGPERSAEPLWYHPGLSGRFEELQFTLGEGPGPEVVRTGSPILEPDLDRVRSARWPALLPAARELGVHGVCCFPLAIGAIRIGVLTVLCDGNRQLSQQQYADAIALTAALTSAFLSGEIAARTEACTASTCPCSSRLYCAERSCTRQREWSASSWAYPWRRPCCVCGPRLRPSPRGGGGGRGRQQAPLQRRIRRRCERAVFARRWKGLIGMARE